MSTFISQLMDQCQNELEPLKRKVYPYILITYAWSACVLLVMTYIAYRLSR
jgi:hypothetical protein